MNLRRRAAAAALLTAATLFLTGFKTAENNPYYDGDPARAIKFYEKKLQQEPYNQMHYFNLASVEKEFGDNKRAFDLYREIALINDKEMRAHFELAKTYYFLGAMSYAEEEIKTLVRRDIVNWEVNFWWGNILAEQGKYAEALEKYEAALQGDDRKSVIYLKMADVHEMKKDYVTAADYCKKALKRDKTFTELNIRIARLCEKSGDNTGAYNYWKAAGEIDTKAEEPRLKVAQYARLVPGLKEKIKAFISEKKSERDAFIPPDKVPVPGAGQIPVIKAGIMEGAEAVYFKCGSDFTALDSKDRFVFKGAALAEHFVFYDKKKKKFAIGTEKTREYFDGELYILREVPAATTYIYNIEYGSGFYWAERRDTPYRGNLLFIPSKKTLTLVNLVNIEEYLYGVVPSEMPSTWPLEALKTQAVAARTYTYRHLRRHEGGGYDVCSTQHCAVYKGLNGENALTNKAVDETRGMVLKEQNGRFVNTFYSHCCGGHTQDAHEVWNLSRTKSLEGAFDGEKNGSWDFPLQPFFLEEWVRTIPAAYCKADGGNEISFRWIRYLRQEDLQYFINRKYGLGRIKDLFPVYRAQGGALVKLEVIGEKGSQTVGFDQMRNILGKIRSNVIKWEYRKDAAGFIRDIYIYGAGWGHGVGMCQRGASGMAEKKKDFPEILFHYYPGSGISKEY